MDDIVNVKYVSLWELVVMKASLCVLSVGQDTTPHLTTAGMAVLWGCPSARYVP